MVRLVSGEWETGDWRLPPGLQTGPGELGVTVPV